MLAAAETAEAAAGALRAAVLAGRDPTAVAERLRTAAAEAFDLLSRPALAPDSGTPVSPDADAAATESVAEHVTEKVAPDAGPAVSPRGDEQPSVPAGTPVDPSAVSVVETGERGTFAVTAPGPGGGHDRGTLLGYVTHSGRRWLAVTPEGSHPAGTPTTSRKTAVARLVAHHTRAGDRPATGEGADTPNDHSHPSPPPAHKARKRSGRGARFDLDTVRMERGELGRWRVLAGDTDPPIVLGFLDPARGLSGRTNGWQALTTGLLTVPGGPHKTRRDALAGLVDDYLRQR